MTPKLKLNQFELTLHNSVTFICHYLHETDFTFGVVSLLRVHFQ